MYTEIGRRSLQRLTGRKFVDKLGYIKAIAADLKKLVDPLQEIGPPAFFAA
ncbi:MAG TPA: hypothetical protein VFP47_18275 [Pyrinomonadaceae bacterium]|nr:hypothetical protein [Pyrinomonadaceae bacterium]